MPSASAQNNGQSDEGSAPVRRDVLPIPDVAHIGEDAKEADHYIDADERFRIAMARQ
jgi:hypothetical protein